MNSCSLAFPSTSISRRTRRGAFAVFAVLLVATGVSAVWAQSVPSAGAQVAPATVPVPVIEGKTLDGKPFKLSMLKGKVVLVMFWSTGCAVCRGWDCTALSAGSVTRAGGRCGWFWLDRRVGILHRVMTEAVAGAGDGDDLGVVPEAIQDRRRRRHVADQLAPILQ